MRRKKIIDLSKKIVIELIKIPLTLIPLLLFTLGLIKISIEWRSILGPLMGIRFPDPNANGVNILIGLALISLSSILFTILVGFKATLQGWVTASILFLSLVLLLIILIVTPLFDLVAARIFFAKGSCEFFVESYGDHPRGQELAEFCRIGKNTFSIKTD